MSEQSAIKNELCVQSNIDKLGPGNKYWTENKTKLENEPYNNGLMSPRNQKYFNTGNFNQWDYI